MKSNNDTDEAINTFRQVDKNHPSFFVSWLLWKEAHKRQRACRRSKFSGSVWNGVAFRIFARKYSTNLLISI